MNNNQQNIDSALRQLIENSPLATLITMGDRQEILLLNAAFTQLFGYDSSDVTSVSDWWPLAYPDETYCAQIESQWAAMAEEATKNCSKTELMDVTITCKDGSTREIECRMSSIGSMNIVVFIDLTERKLTETALRDRNRFVESLINLSPDVIYIYDLVDSKNVYSNDGIQRILGYSVEEIKQIGSQLIPFLMHPDDLKVYSEETIPRYAQAKDNELISHIYRMKHKNGNWSWLESTELIYMRQADGSPQQIFGVIHEITERKQAEEALLEVEWKFKALFEKGPIGVAYHAMIYDASGKPIDYRFLDANETFLELTGVDPRGKTVIEAFPGIENDPFDWIGTFGKVARTGKQIRFEQYLQYNDRWYDVVGYQYKPDHFVAAFLNITKRKVAELAAAESKAEAERRAAEMESFVSNIADGVALFDAEGNLVSINPAGRNMFGASDDEPFADWWNQFKFYTIDGVELSQDELPVFTVLRGQKVHDLRLKVIAPWGKEVLISSSAAPIIASDGTIGGVTLVFRDQSERIETEQEREELYMREHNIAQVLQKALLPHKLPQMPGCEIAVVYRPASREAEVGGDFYDAFEIGDRKLAVLIGDVTGKGLPAAVRVATARHTIRSCAYIDPKPSKVMSLANEVLCKSLSDVDEGMITAAFVVLDTITGMMTMAIGGHEPVALRRANGEVEQIDVTGRVLGVLGGFIYPEVSLKLDAGDMVVMVTDGITEARETGGEFFGIEGVMNFLSYTTLVSANEMASGLLDTAKAHGGGRLRDDAVVLALEMKDNNSDKSRSSG